MNALRILSLSAACFAAPGAALAGAADAALDRAVGALRQDAGARGAWVNAWMPHGTGRYAAESADRILTATLRVYTREVLDRGGWINPFMGARHYDAGNALLAVRPGEGVTTAGSAPRPRSAGALIAGAPDACIDSEAHARTTRTPRALLVGLAGRR